MIPLLRDFGLFLLPVLVAVGGWLYALALRRRARRGAQQKLRALA